MKVNILHKLELVFISFIQLFLIAINTYFLTFRISIGVIFASIFISLFWSYSVKKVIQGSFYDRLMIAIGGVFGNLFAMWSIPFLLPKF